MSKFDPLDERVWALLDPSRPDEWHPATLLSRAAGDDVEVLTDDGQRAVVPVGRAVPRNSEEQDRVADLAQLVHLSEPCLLHALASRYAAGDIYTYTGSILIALNPWQAVDPLYSAEQLAAYRGQPLGAQAPRLQSGDLYLFRGRGSLHRVSPVRAGQRINAILTYNSDPHDVMNAYTRRKFFGRDL